MLYYLTQIPMYAGGDQTVDPFLSLMNSPTSPANNINAYFSGTDDYLYTRGYAYWLGLDYISMLRKDYESLYKVKEFYAEPYHERVYVNFKIPCLNYFILA
jgi:hypothetical protein